MDAPHIWTVGKRIQYGYYCIVYYKYSSVIDENHFKVYYMKFLFCKLDLFENDLFLLVHYLIYNDGNTIKIMYLNV